MSIKSGIIILVLSVLVTYGVSIIEGFMNGSSLAGASGWPFRFGYSSFFGGSNINYLMLILDVSFWFVVIFGVKKFLLKK